LIPEPYGIDDDDWIIDDDDCKICKVDWVIDGDCVIDVVDGINTIDCTDEVNCAAEDIDTVDCVINCETGDIVDIVDVTDSDDNVTAEDVCVGVIDTADDKGDTMTTKTRQVCDKVSKECDQSEMWW